MEQENQNLEKKKGKNWVLRIGLGMLLIGAVLGRVIYFIINLRPGVVENLGWLPIVIGLWYISCIGLFITIVGLILSIQERRKKIILTPIALLIYFLIIGQFPISDFVIITPFEQLAIITNNKNICNYIPIISENPKTSCLEKVTYKLAVIRKDYRICDQLSAISSPSFPSRRDNCYYSVAEETKDESICDKISFRDCCNSRDHCYGDLAVLKNDESICEKIDRDYIWAVRGFDPGVEVKYIDVCYENVARDKK